MKLVVSFVLVFHLFLYNEIKSEESKKIDINIIRIEKAEDNKKQDNIILKKEKVKLNEDKDKEFLKSLLETKVYKNRKYLLSVVLFVSIILNLIFIFKNKNIEKFFKEKQGLMKIIIFFLLLSGVISNKGKISYEIIFLLILNYMYYNLEKITTFIKTIKKIESPYISFDFQELKEEAKKIVSEEDKEKDIKIKVESENNQTPEENKSNDDKNKLEKEIVFQFIELEKVLRETYERMWGRTQLPVREIYSYLAKDFIEMRKYEKFFKEINIYRNRIVHGENIDKDEEDLNSILRALDHLLKVVREKLKK